MINSRIFMEHISIRPNKMVVYTRECHAPSAPAEKKKQDSLKVPQLVQDRQHDFELSVSAQRNIQDKITWLYQFAKKRTFILASGKVISDFKMNFVTLTLPSVQRHSSDFITKNCLNQMLTELVARFGLRNYVWRLEYQKNGNIHYHIASDMYMDYHVIRNIWNRILEKHEYVTHYQNKFRNMSLAQYFDLYGKGDHANFSACAARYAKGVSENWKNPHSVDVKVCTNSKAVAFYISKYFGKSSSSDNRISLAVNEGNSGHSRLWFCSRSLSKLKVISDIREAMTEDFLGLLFRANKFRKVVCDYCTIFYFNMRDLDSFGYQRLTALFNEYAQEVGYSPQVFAEG